MVIIYILAVIGGICVLGVIGLVIMFLITPTEPEDDTEITCALTGEHCIFTSQRETCNGCPVSEEAEKIGNR